MAQLTVGNTAPDFTLDDLNGKQVSLSDFKGKKVILYFYPKDDTSGCTKEACDFRDNLPKIQGLGAVVLGVSPDDKISHQKFSEKNMLSFQLLCDPQHRVAEAYGAWGTKKMMGREYEGIIRSTFIIDEGGMILAAWYTVNVEKHIAQVIFALQEV